jgi:hypothetical protein
MPLRELNVFGVVLRPSRAVLPAILVASIFSAPRAASAQDTREEEQAKQQQEKASSLKEDTPNRLERWFLNVDRKGGFTVPPTWSVAFGDIKRGSGIALGPLYSKLFASGALFTAKAGYSIRSFKMAQIAMRSPQYANGRFVLSGRARWQDAPELPVYPLGRDSVKIRTNYGERKTEGSVQALLQPVRVVRFGVGSGFEAFRTSFPTHATGPEESGSPGALPGIDADPEYVHSFVSAAIDSRAGPGYSRSGSRLEGIFHDYRQTNSGPYSFRRVDGIAEQLIPILHGNWVIDLAVRASSTTTAAGDVVPFFLMPDLGGSDMLRAFGNYRFRDRHSILFTGEYRWYAQEFLDVALFYDAGKVVPRRGDLDFSHLKNSYGLGFRFHTPRTTLVRLEVARSREGTSLIFAFSPSIQ